MKTAPRFLLIVLLTLFFAACSSGGDDNQPPEGNNQNPDPVDKPSIYENDPFTMFLLPDTEEVKGVLFFLTGGNGDGRPWVRGQVANDPEATAAR
ncbi:MAG: hypothetical protein HKN31_12685, partial [Pricia sp.]|nr:hypothetical protein [Pricia sp.]